ncbi:MAG: SpoIIE family protein phosphatase [candidate division Zixibacteria bacterium]|nr:SpoIIE family protein phosphatase [candidate division Zixibacteria bacterium]
MDRLEELERKNKSLGEALDELGALNQIATAIGSSLSLEEVNERIVQLVVKRVGASQGGVFLLPEKGESKMQTMVRVKATGSQDDPARLGTAFIGWVIKNQRPIKISRNDDPEGFLKQSTGNVESALSVPIKSQGKLIGALSVFNKRMSDSFTDGDKRLLSIVAAQSAQVIEKMRLFEVEKHLTEIKKELSVARIIQGEFLPSECPKINGYDIYAVNLQADDVGGDSYDIIQLSDSKLLFSLSDVCGHGIAAALMMAMAQTVIRAQLESKTNALDDLGAFVSGVSDYIQRNSKARHFVTSFIGVLDLDSHSLEYVRAGHPPGMLVDAEGNMTELDQGGLPLGIVKGTKYGSSTVAFPADGRLLVYSDGVTELPNEKNEQFGAANLAEYVKNEAKSESTKFCENLINVLKNYRGKAAQDDDVTLLTVRRF